MIFTSFIFLFWFLPAVLPIYLALPTRWRNWGLTIGSFLFYGWWRPHYVVLMLASALLDYSCARAMGGVGSGRRRKLLLWIAIAGNLALLGYFKYANLAVSTWNDVAPWPLAWEEVLLPIGISFYTFQSMSYTIDVYRGQVSATRSFPELLCFVSMFPQLVAGPIVRYRDIQAQLRSRTVDFMRFGDGVFLFAMGFAKKVLIADQVAPLAEWAFGLDQPGLAAAWLGATAFAAQIYFDFSGYSDMAIGLGLMLGFRFPSNFLSPYKAHSITEFWRRWHVSLSTWLRDYLYISLGGNRRGPVRTYVNLMLTMLLGGLWHGAAWTFVLWGLWQGAFLVVERLLGKAAPYGFLPRPFQVLLTFVIVLAGWVIFAADGVDGLLAMWSGMVGVHGAGTMAPAAEVGPMAYPMLIIGMLIAFVLPRSEVLVQRFQPLVMLSVLAAFFVAVAHLLATDYSPFLYWRF